MFLRFRECFSSCSEANAVHNMVFICMAWSGFVGDRVVNYYGNVGAQEKSEDLNITKWCKTDDSPQKEIHKSVNKYIWGK